MWVEHCDQVRPEWVDGNGHLNLAFFVLVFDRGTDAWLEAAGLGEAYRQTARCSVFAVEAHTRYLREARLGADLLVRTRAASAGPRRVHLLHEMRSQDEDVATHEVLFAHVDLVTRKAVAMPADAAGRVAALLPAGSEAGLPGWVGRRVGDAPLNRP